MSANWLIFTDLDGTLLDAQTYSFAAARPALHFLAKQNIPVLPCTSKTYSEVSRILVQLKLNTPFIVENGSALFWPQGYFKLRPAQTGQIGGNEYLPLGRPYAEVLDFFRQLQAFSALSLVGFHEMDLKRIMTLTGLHAPEATRAKERLFSEPFIVEGGKSLRDDIFSFVRDHGFRLLKGNRFYHLLGDSDKGKALKRMIQLFERQTGRIYKTLGLGDSPNDFAMLKAVDLAVLVKKTDGTHASELQLENIIRTEGVGPKGWQEAVFKVIR